VVRAVTDTFIIRGGVITIIAFATTTAVAWFVVPGPRWALVTLGASASLLLIVVSVAAFPLPRQAVAVALTANASIHVIAFALSLNVAPTLTVGDPPGRMLSSFSIPSASHAIRYRVPLPQPKGDRMQVRLVLARPYEGPAHLLIDVSGRVNGVMNPGFDNVSERRFTFDIAPFRTDSSVLLTISPDIPDPKLRIAIWRSGLGRALPDEPEYVTEHGAFLGILDPLTGRLNQASWPVVWVTDP
jgi:hypothetical protein